MPLNSDARQPRPNSFKGPLRSLLQHELSMIYQSCWNLQNQIHDHIWEILLFFSFVFCVLYFFYCTVLLSTVSKIKIFMCGSLILRYSMFSIFSSHTAPPSNPNQTVQSEGNKTYSFSGENLIFIILIICTFITISWGIFWKARVIAAIFAVQNINCILLAAAREFCLRLKRNEDYGFWIMTQCPIACSGLKSMEFIDIGGVAQIHLQALTI